MRESERASLSRRIFRNCRCATYTNPARQARELRSNAHQHALTK